MKKETKDMIIGVIVLFIAIAVGAQILSVSGLQKMNEVMCEACQNRNWQGMITGELSYSCEWTKTYPNYTIQSFQEWCYENAPLFRRVME
jgi:hypothetical protein